MYSAAGSRGFEGTTGMDGTIGMGGGLGLGENNEMDEAKVQLADK
jgi:hypothetical protein